jgi:hypothetical protein
MSELPQIVHPSADSWDLFENRELSLTSDQAKTPPIACAEWLQQKHARPERQALRDRDNSRVRPILDDQQSLGHGLAASHAASYSAPDDEGRREKGKDSRAD